VAFYGFEMAQTPITSTDEMVEISDEMVEISDEMVEIPVYFHRGGARFHTSH
jgi:hypothetical protein